MASLWHSLITFIVTIYWVNETYAMVYGDCNLGKNAVDELLSVRVANCEHDTYCSFVRGSEASIEIDFKAGMQMLYEANRITNTQGACSQTPD